MTSRRWDAVVDRVLNSTGISEPEFYRRGRPTRKADTARKAAVYLARVELLMPRRDVAQELGISERHVKRACAAVEDRRDDDRGFEAWVEDLAEQLRGLDLGPTARRTLPAPAFAVQQAA